MTIKSGLSRTDKLISYQVKYLEDKCLYQISGNVKVPGVKIEYLAANPPDLRFADAGCALPFASEDMAFNPSINRGTVIPKDNGYFMFTIRPPNAYYTSYPQLLDNLNHPHLRTFEGYWKYVGIFLNKPNIELLLVNDNQILENYEIQLNDGYANRSLTNLPNKPTRTDP